tara:strand:- start:25 stop:255 length:231 start_codon:yes stop_codon:yes gene_type:complete
MQIKAPRMTRAHYNFIADVIAPQVSWPTKLRDIADELEATNSAFNRGKFLSRATKAWEAAQNVDELNDEIPYERLQ